MRTQLEATKYISHGSRIFGRSPISVEYSEANQRLTLEKEELNVNGGNILNQSYSPIVVNDLF